MTSALTPPPVATRPEPDERGALTVADRAIERIATQVLAELDDVGGAGRRVLGVAVADAAPDGDAAVRAVVDGDTVRLSARLSVVYPTPVRRTAAAARDRLRARVEALTGLVVTRVDVVVTALTGAAVPRRVQ